MRTLLLDADIIAFKFASSTETVCDFGDEDGPGVSSNFEEAREKAESEIDRLVMDLDADHVIVCLSDPSRDYFRKDHFPPYKAARSGTYKPEQLMALKDWLAKSYQTYWKPRLEADDCMGILATHPTLISGEKVMVSEDKDMKTIPALLYNPRHPKRGIVKISKPDADRFFYWQTICGDTVDGYPGAIGVGPKSPEAQGVLKAQSGKEAWSLVLQAFKRSRSVAALEGMYVEAALSQARCARILRATDWDFREKRPRVWMPPT